MRSLSSTLLAAQKSTNPPVYKLFLKSGATEYTYTKTRIVGVTHRESLDDYHAMVILNNDDGVLTGLNFSGFAATISYGMTTTSDEYSDTTPMLVVSQDVLSYRGGLACRLYMIGRPNQLKLDKASADYFLDYSDPKKVKALITEILNGQPVASTAVEQQTLGTDVINFTDLTVNMAGFFRTVPNRTITKLAFMLKKFGLPAGDIYFVIKDVTDTTTYQSQVICSAGALSDTEFQWKEITWAAPVAINEPAPYGCHFYIEYPDSNATNYIIAQCNHTAVKAGEYMVKRAYGGSWENFPDYDMKYKYTYTTTGITVYSHCAAYVAVFDSEDALIDVYTPQNTLKIYYNDNRYDVVEKLLGYTNCVGRWQNDAGVAKFHIMTVPAETKDQYYDSGADSTSSVYGVNWWAQTFTPSVSHTITKVRLLLFRAGSPGTVTVSIRATDGNGHPTGADLCSGTTNGDTITTNSAGEYVTIIFTAPVALTGSTKYAIVLRVSAIDYPPNALGWKRDKSSPTYAGGNAEGSSNSGSTWSSSAEIDWDADYLFEEWYGLGYAYSLVSGEHYFFNKSKTNRLVIPNKIIVSSLPDDLDQWTGSATDATSYALVPIETHIRMKLATSAQGTAVATAIIAQLSRDASSGRGLVRMNVGQELQDYVTFTDSRAVDSVSGNVTGITRNMSLTQWDMEVEFGSVHTRSMIGTGIPQAPIEPEAEPSKYASQTAIKDVWNTLKDLSTLLEKVKSKTENVSLEDIKTETELNTLITSILDPHVTELEADIAVNTTGIATNTTAITSLKTKRLWIPVTSRSTGGGLTDSPLFALSGIPVALLAATGDEGAMSFCIPSDFVSLTSAQIIVFSVVTDAAANWDIKSAYGAIGEGFTQHTATDTTTTYNVVAGNWYAINCASILASLAANDYGGVSVVLGDSADDVDVVGLYIVYLGS